MNLISIFNTFYTTHITGKQSRFIAQGYRIALNKVFYHPGMGSGPAFEVHGADAGSFEISGKSSADARYGRDRNNVYFNGRVVRGADPGSFLRMKPGYVRDAGSVFYNGSLLSNDADYFQFVDTFVQKDRWRVYRGGWIISDDPDHFMFLNEIDGFSYYRDSKGVLVNGSRLPGADPATFVPLRHGYSRDADQVYRVDGMVARIIADACPEEFNVFNAYYTHDKRNVFWQGKLLPEADPATFASLYQETNRRREASKFLPDKIAENVLDPQVFLLGREC